jgi:acyl-CoA synthetase (AMP-forming)/AMP-acid ligase II
MLADPERLRRPPASMVDVLLRRAMDEPKRLAYVFLSDRGAEEDALTYAELHRRACALAVRLADSAQPGDRALLLSQPGLDFIVGLFGCFLAGVIAVPTMIPRRSTARDSSAAILADCAPRVAVTNSGLAEVRPDIVERLREAGVAWLVADPALDESADRRPQASVEREDIAFLQYTSGSTSLPKGVMVTHANLLENLEMIRIAFRNTPESTCVSWAPLYHDMGLILNVLQSIYVGALCVLMAPQTFLQRPLTWLRAIHDYRGENAGGPNFAYDLCADRFRPEAMAGIDLSCWKVAFSGAEPVRPDTIERFTKTFAPFGFRAHAMYPAFGLAEATLMVTGRGRGAGPVNRIVSRAALQRHEVVAPADDRDRQALAGCGRAVEGEQVAIVDPDTLRRLAPCEVGEIWIQGPNVARGYWRNADATAETFHGRIAGEASGPWLRTGDLGFLDQTGELYITGRIKDVIIIRGINHYPQDIEDTVQSAHPGLPRNGGAAFSWIDEQGQEKLVVVQEVERTFRHRVKPHDIVGSVREAFTTEHGIPPYAIVLIRPGALPKTTSGKIQRGLARRLWLEGKLDVLE